MQIINFSHPLTEQQRKAIEAMTGETISAVHEVPFQLDHDRPFVPQIVELIDTIPLSAEQWQTEPLLVNLPGLSIAAGIVTAELHGRMGYFPACIRLRPVKDRVPLRFEVAEIIGLEQVRQAARTRRY